MMNDQSSIKMGATDPPLTLFDTRMLDGSAAERHCFIQSLREACRDVGAFYLANHSIPKSLCKDVIDGAQAFFALPPEDKANINIRKSKHFRGYSHMSNERDWREQVHLGLEQPAMACAPDAPGPLLLQGPNLWPVQLGEEWQMSMLSFLSAVDALSRRLLSALAAAAELPRGYFDRLAQDTPYLLMKLICYYPQLPGQPLRNGVAPHCDWSWLTFLLQHEAGLQVRTRNGQWLDVLPIDDTLVVNLGELMEIVTSDYFYATPHRVRNVSPHKSRIAIPVFINPSLHAVITPTPLPEGLCGDLNSESTSTEDRDLIPHVHRVVDTGKQIRPFVFGDSEWQRKGLGRWCYKTKCHNS